MEREGIIKDLETFLEELRKYYHLRHQMGQRNFTSKELEQVADLRGTLVRKSGKYKKLIAEITEIENVSIVINNKEYPTDIWSVGLLANPVTRTPTALGYCIDSVGQAIGKLEDDIRTRKRDAQTGGILTKAGISRSEAPKAFIAHEGETEQLKKLKDFLDALGIKYFIAEAEASDGRSIEGQVDWTQAKADFAICLATKGKAINKKTGKHYMGLNVADELGRARQVFSNHIILLVQKGVEVHTNTKEIVHAPFTTQSMDIAFTKVIKELRNWGFIQVGKLEE